MGDHDPQLNITDSDGDQLRLTKDSTNNCVLVRTHTPGEGRSGPLVVLDKDNTRKLIDYLYRCLES